MNIKRGDMFYADLSPVVGSEQGGIRPVLIIQNDLGNKYSPTVIAAAITSQKTKNKLPTHIEINSKDFGLKLNINTRKKKNEHFKTSKSRSNLYRKTCPR